VLSLGLGCASLALLVSCAENDDHAPLGSGGGGTSGTDGDADSDADGDGDSDADGGADSDADTDADTCTEQEVEGPAGLRCWRRCPAGESWDDGFCVGGATFHDFAGASNACAAIDGGYHLATRAELLSLLTNCGDEVIEDEQEGLCDSCAGSDPCYEMFGPDALTYWSSSSGELGPWAVAFDVGTVFMAESDELPYNARCVRPL
jgi:hypothetical protein